MYICAVAYPIQNKLLWGGSSGLFLHAFSHRNISIEGPREQFLSGKSDENTELWSIWNYGRFDFSILFVLRKSEDMEISSKRDVNVIIY